MAEVVYTKNAPDAIGPYSQAMKVLRMTVCRSSRLSESERARYEIQNREKYRAGNADPPAVFPKAVFGTVAEPLPGRNGGATDRPNRLRLFRGREKRPQPDAAFRCAGGCYAAE